MSEIVFRERLQAIIDWADLALKNSQEFNSHGVRNLCGPVFDAAREALVACPSPQPHVVGSVVTPEQARNELARREEAGSDPRVPLTAPSNVASLTDEELRRVKSGDGQLTEGLRKAAALLLNHAEHGIHGPKPGWLIDCRRVIEGFAGSETGTEGASLRGIIGILQETVNDREKVIRDLKRQIAQLSLEKREG